MFNNFYRKHKELLLKISSIFLVVLFFAVIEVVVRILYPAKALDHMIDLGPINLFSKKEINGETWYGITNKNAYSDRNVSFKEKKDAGQIRIVCLGGSASAGWPHPPEEIYSRYLEKSLQKLYPEKKIEVINCSAHGFASYRIRQVFESIIPLDPDAVIIWCGNNEFLEGRNYRTSEFKNTLMKLRNNFRSLQLVRQLLVEHRYDDTPEVAETFWKKVNQEALVLRSDPEQFEKVKEHYRRSISGIVDEASENDIRVMLMTVPVNLRDWEPNVSWLGLSQKDSAEWAAAFRTGKKHLLNKKYSEAMAALNRAHTLAPLHAETFFMMGKTAEQSGDTIAALEHYVMAKDLDYNPFRAISDLNNALRDIASENPEVFLLDMEHLINGYAEKGVPGFDLFLDYVHPTREGNLIIAKEAANRFANGDILSIGSDAPPLSLRDVWEINASEYQDEEDMFLQFTRFSLCCMTHQYYSALRFGKILRETLPRQSLENDPTGRMTILSDAIVAFQAYTDMEQRSLVEEISANEERKVMDGIRAFYAKHFPYGVF